MTKQKVPKLRFPEFTGEWEMVTLDEKDYIKGRIGWKNLKAEEYTDFGPYLIAGKHIKKGIINWNKCDHISMKRYEESIEIALKKGDVIFSKDGSIGNPALIEELPCEATINGTMMLIRVNNQRIDSKYFYYILRTNYFERLIKIVKSGSSIPHIFQRDMKFFKFPIPSLPEQEKIADFLTLFDKEIELEEKKLELLKENKKGYMQKIFSQEIRFKDEFGNDYPQWEEKKIKFNYNVEMCKRIYKNETLIEGEIPFYKIGTFGGKADAFISVSLFNEYQKKYKYPKKEDTLISCSGTVGKCILFDGNPSYYQDSNIVWLREKKNRILKKFLFYILKNLTWKELPSTTIKRIYSKDLLNKLINFPSLLEQEKIANFLSTADEEIELMENKIEKLKEIKKGLLQEMFI